MTSQTGFSRKTLARLAVDHGIKLREGPQDYKRKGFIDREWLFEQYVGQGRTLPDLAHEKNMSTANMARWAHVHQIPLRPRGGASHDSSLRTMDQAADLPAPIARAVAGRHNIDGEQLITEIRRAIGLTDHNTLTAPSLAAEARRQRMALPALPTPSSAPVGGRVHLLQQQAAGVGHAANSRSC
jgi:hypothetical protein